MNQAITYQFTIKALSPVHFGDSEQGEVVTDANGQPFVLGNAIGGALRDYLCQVYDCEGQNNLILKYMGGIKENGGDFRESSIFISDGEVNGVTEIREKEGTAIDAAYGAAKEGAKYTMKYLPEGTEITFRVECDEWTKIVKGENGKRSEKVTHDPSEFESMIDVWARGFMRQRLMLGGQKSNGFGKFELKELKKTVYSFNSIEALDRYIFDRDEVEGKSIDLSKYKETDERSGEGRQEPVNRQHADQRKHGAVFRHKDDDVTVFKLVGQFPYGIYQGFTVKNGEKESSYTLTGLQDKDGHYFLPASSVKGVIRSEVYRLLVRMLGGDHRSAEKKCEELFGSTEQRGKLVFSDVTIENEKVVEITRCEKKQQDDKDNSQPSKHPIYNKIDRLTGGAFDGHLKHQQEVQGTATIQVELYHRQQSDQIDAEKNPYIFPLIYVLRRIGAGIVPLGGRTAIGLGQFAANRVTVQDRERREIETDGLLSNQEWLKEQFEVFEGWCYK